MEITLQRKMRLIPIFLLCAASALAADNTNYNGPPMDYYDSFNPNTNGRPSTFSFNFEQTRRDQPPQIEMREENVGRYIHARPQTTTPASIFSMKADKPSQHVYPVFNNNYNQPQPQWSPPPPPPKLDFSRHANDANLPRNPPPAWSGPPVPHNVPKPNFPPQVPIVPTPPPPHPAQWIQPPKPQSTPAPYYPPNPPKPPPPPAGVSFAPSASYVSDSIRHPAPRQPTSPPNRGSHKFSWDDVQKPEEIKQIMNNPQPKSPSAPQSIHNKPPPPVPTLTPWYDNFGK